MTSTFLIPLAAWALFFAYTRSRGLGWRSAFLVTSVVWGCAVHYIDVCHIYNIRHERRDELKTYLAEHDIQTEIHYPVPPYRQKALQGMFDIDAYSLADKIHNTTLSLPISICHSEEDVVRVIAVMNRFGL